VIYQRRGGYRCTNGSGHTALCAHGDQIYHDADQLTATCLYCSERIRRKSRRSSQWFLDDKKTTLSVRADEGKP
jgi:hypothetical protein